MRSRFILCWLALLLSSIAGSAQDWQALWKSYAAAFMDNQVRVIDHNAGDRTTSEGQAYGMFFALVANDRARFDGLLQWTQANLASGDLSAHLPAWLWGKRSDGKWGVLDGNSASDADAWIAYSLLQAGSIWKEPSYTRLGTALAKLIAENEVLKIPDFGTVLMPGANGFHNSEVYRLNASYLPLQLFVGLATALPDGPWQQIAAQTPSIVHGSSPSGFATDWVEYRPGKGFTPVGVGSYDAIRVYLWAGMLDPATPKRAEILEALGGMRKYLHANPSPPEKVRVDGTVESSNSPIGFSAAVIPYLAALGEKDLESAETSRLQSSVDPKTGLIGNPAKYYDLNLALFAIGWEQQRFEFDSRGHLNLPRKAD